MKKGFIKKDREYIWHPYTQMKDYEKYDPVLITKAKGIKLYDDNGNAYLDTISSWWCNVHGHSHPKINKAIKQQLDSFEHVMFAGFTHEGAVKLAEQLISITPKKLRKVFYSDNGSTAVEVALKMSYQYWQNTGKNNKKKFISLHNSYHGDTIGTMSISGTSHFHSLFNPMFFKSYKIPSPYCYRCPVKEENNCALGCIMPLEKLLKTKSSKIAGIILEPILQAAGGMIVYPPAYLKKVAQLARRYNIHLIVDEVATGFGRTGKMFAVEHAGVEPDIMCLSKGITAGYMPLAATLASQKIYNAFYADYSKNKTFFHGHTYSANPLGVAAAIASLELFKEDKVLEKAKKTMAYLQKEIRTFKELPFVGDVRGIGMVAAIELVKNKKTKEPFPATQRIGWHIYRESLKHGLILRPLGNTIYLFLPFCIKPAELKTILRKARLIITKLTIRNM